MTKKFFKDWSDKRSLTESIELKSTIRYEKYDKVFYIYGYMLKLDTLNFEGDYITIVADAQFFGKKASNCGIKTFPLKIHRKDIETVKFKKL